MPAGSAVNPDADFTDIKLKIRFRCRGLNSVNRPSLRVSLFHLPRAYADRMMRMTVLASGSKGNSTLVASSRTRILVDAGLSCRELLKRMHKAGEDPSTIDALVITHEHQDHVQGVAVLARKLGIPVYFTEPTHRAWIRWMMPHKRITYADWLLERREDLARRRQLEAAAPSGNAPAASHPDPEP